MPHVDPLDRARLPELEELFGLYDETLGFCPNSLFTLARRPEILRALSELITQVWRTGTVPMALKPLIALVASRAAGCRYCQAHEAVDAQRRHWDEGEIVEILAVVSLFGFLNRWNDAMATRLEETPLAQGRRLLTRAGWGPGKHAPP
jgi:AhpD family alkylhydroperoxidase